ncbi:MAG: hypothetical protein N2381_09220 [Armatimonadetes bacterium]|nr:hypothetical protein [Armatimonadota bacterium]MCX7778215.1 hypothetical protein [Armatimonadota bacterium]
MVCLTREEKRIAMHSSANRGRGVCLARLFPIAAFTVLTLRLCSGDEYGSVNLIRNSSFECGTVGWQGYLPWAVGIGYSLPRLHGEVVRADDAPHGEMVLRLKANAARATLKPLWLSANAVEPLMASTGWIRLCAGKTYTLSAFMRSDGDAVAKIAVYHPSGHYYEHQCRVSKSWQRYQLTFEALDEPTLVVIGPCSYGNQAGEASVFVDAAQLECNSTPSPYKPRSQFEFFVASDAPGNVWMRASDMNLCLVGYNDGEDAEITVDARVTNYQNAVVSRRKMNIKISKASKTLIPLSDLLPKAFGFYRVSVHAYDNSQQLLGIADARFALLRVFDGVDSPFGLDGVYACGNLMLLAKRAGVLWRKVRLRGLDEFELVGENDNADAKVDWVLKFGLHGLLSISTSALPDARKSVTEMMADVGCTEAVNAGLIAQFVESKVKLYRTRITAFELLYNEPQHVVCSQAHSHQVSNYIELLKVAYKSAKGLCRDCLFLGGVRACRIETAREFAKGFIAAGGLKFADALALEICLAQSSPEMLEQLIKESIAQMDAQDKRKPIWVTIWWSHTGGDAYGRLPESFEDELADGARYVRLAAILLSHGVSKIFHSNGHELPKGHFGGLFFEPDGAPKMALSVQAALASLLTSSPLPLGSLNLGSDGRCYVFRTKKGVTAVAWLVDGGAENADVHLPLGRYIKAYDIMGNEIKSSKVKLSSVPIFLTSTARDLRSFASVVRSYRHQSSSRRRH